MIKSICAPSIYLKNISLSSIKIKTQPAKLTSKHWLSNQYINPNTQHFPFFNTKKKPSLFVLIALLPLLIILHDHQLVDSTIKMYYESTIRVWQTEENREGSINDKLVWAAMIYLIRLSLIRILQEGNVIMGTDTESLQRRTKYIC